MSERGIEIHNGQIVFPEGMPPELHLGTEGSPLIQSVASQIVISAVINAIALSGVVAGQFIVVASVSQTGALKGLHVGTTINTAVVMTGSAWGIHIEQELLGTGSIVNDPPDIAYWEGIRMEISSAVGTAAAYGIAGIFMSNYNLGTISGNYWMLRLQENGTATVTSMFYCRGGTGGVDYLFALLGTTDAWSANDTPSGAAGWIRVDMGGVPRWIQLYNAAP